MTDKDYAALLEKARLDRAEAGAERMRLDKRIEQLDGVIAALRTLVERPVIDPRKGITECVKEALKMAYPASVFPTTLRTFLEQSGFDFSGQANQMASIHAILKRLEGHGLVRSKVGRDGQGRAYTWAENPDQIDLPPDVAAAVKRAKQSLKTGGTE